MCRVAFALPLSSYHGHLGLEGDARSVPTCSETVLNLQLRDHFGLFSLF